MTNAPTGQQKIFRWPDLSAYGCYLNIYIEETGKQVMSLSGEITNEIREKIEGLGFVRLPAGLYALTRMYPEFSSRLSQAFPDMRMLREGDVCADGEIMSKSSAVRDLTKPDVRRMYGNPVRNIAPEKDDLTMRVTSRADQENQEEGVEAVDNEGAQEVMEEEEAVPPRASFILPVVDVNGDPVKDGEVERAFDMAGLRSLDNYLPEIPLYEDRNGVRYVQRKVFGEDGQERSVLVMESPNDGRRGWFLRVASDEDLSSAAFRFVREMNNRPIMAEEFKRWTRAINAIAQEDDIPQAAMDRALAAISLEISKNVVRNASLRMRERYDLLCRLVQNMPVIATRSTAPTVTPQLSFALSRAMALDSLPTDAAGMILNDGTGLAAITANNSPTTKIVASCPEGMDARDARALSAFMTQTTANMSVSEDPVLERNALFQYLDFSRQASTAFVEFESGAARAQGESAVELMREDMVNALAVLDTRNAEGRSAILLTATSEEAKGFLSFVKSAYHIEGIASIAPRVVGGKSNQTPLLGIVVGKRHAEIESAGAERTIPDVIQVTDNAELWSWTSSVIAERARFSGLSVDQSSDPRPDEHDNEFQAPYTPMSLVGDSESMVPINQLGPITQLQCWVRDRVESHGFSGPDAIDRFVFDKTGIDVTKGIVSAEQIDFAATALCVFEKSVRDGNAILNADGTGLGKTRENVMVANAAILSAKFVTYTTEHGAHFSDLYSEICALGIQDNVRIMTLNDEPISRDPLTKEVLIPATPRHIVNGLTQRLHFPDGTPMSCYIVSGKERKRLDRMRTELEGMDSDRLTPEQRDTLDSLRKLESIRSKTQFTTIGEEDFMALGGHLVAKEEIKAVHHEAPLYNFFLCTYSQINRPSVEHQIEAQEESRSEKKKPIYRHDKTEFYVNVLAKRGENSLLILDESHNAADCSANTFHNVSSYVDTAKWLIYASATWAKRVQNMQNYRRLLSRTITVESLSELMAKGDEVIHETFARMLAYESYMRRELVMSNCRHQVYSSDKHLGKQVEIINTVNAVRNAIAALHNDIDIRLSWLNKMVEANHSITDILVGASRNSSKEASRFSLSGSVAARRMVNDVVVSVLAMDDIADASIALLNDGIKPYIVVEGTHERFISDFHRKTGRIPTLHDVLRRSVQAATQIKSGRTTIDLGENSGVFDLIDDMADAFSDALPPVFKPVLITEDMDSDTRLALHEEREREVAAYLEENGYEDFHDARMAIFSQVAQRFQTPKNKKIFFEAYMEVHEALLYKNIDRTDLQISFTATLHDRIPRNPAKIARAIHRLIDLVPDMPISTLDFVKDRIAEAGFLCGEITGRTECIKDGEIKRRADFELTDKRSVVDSFNTRSMPGAPTFDAVIGNGASASSLSMHNRVPKTEHEENTLDLRPRAHVSCGNLDDAAKAQQSFGRVYRKNGSGAVYCSVQNQTPAGIRAIARTRRKLRQSSALITSKRDSSFTAGEVLDIEDRVGDIVCFRYLYDKVDLAKELGLHESIQASAKIISTVQGEKLSETCSISSSRVLQAIETLLPYEDQVKILKELESEYHAHIEELDALGINPLRTQNLKGVCRVISKSLISGYEGTDRYQSAFTKPVYLTEVEQTNKIEPITVGTIIASCETSQRALTETPRERADFLWAHRDSILAEYKTDGSVPVDHYIERRDGLIPSIPLVSRYNRLVELVQCLRCLHIGNEVDATLCNSFYPDRGVITGLVMPDRSESPENAQNYSVSMAYPSQDKFDTLRLSSIIHVVKTSLTIPPELKESYGIYPESGLNSDSPEGWINAYNIIRERRSRTLKEKRFLLTGNELIAMSIAIDSQCGHVVTYNVEGVDSSGEPKMLTERAIFVSSLSRLNDRDVQIEAPELAIAALLHLGAIEFSTGGAAASMTVKESKASEDDNLDASGAGITLKLPSYSSKTVSLYEDEDFLRVISSVFGESGLNRIKEMKGTRKRFSAEIPSQRGAVEIAHYMLESGRLCTVDKKHRDTIASIRQSLYGETGQPSVEQPSVEQAEERETPSNAPARQQTSGLLEL